MNKILRIFALTVCVLSGYMAYAQSAMTVKGTVKDSDGLPIIGAVVVVEGHTSTGVTTGVDGEYTITIPAKAGSKAALSVSCLSYETQVKPVAGKSVVDFTLRDDSEQLDEVVVVGYGALRRSDLTGSVTSVKIDDGDAGRATSLDQLLKGKAAGVRVLSNGGSPDSGVSIRVRGATSLNGTNEPLYVVDGVIMSTPSESSFSKGDASESVNAMMGINPQDIASMEILKDASATAIYGAAGANGVVLITTKSANRDKPVIRFNAGIDIAQQYQQMDMLSFDDYTSYIRDQYIAYTNAQAVANETPDKIIGSIADLTDAQLNSIYSRLYEDPLTQTGLKVSPINWQDYMMRTAVSQRYYLSVSGRPKTLSYNFSLGYNNKQGIVMQTHAEQYTMRLNVDKQLFKNFNIGTKTNFAYVSSSLMQGLSTTNLLGSTSMMRSMLVSRPYTWKVDNILEDEVEGDNADLRSTPARWLADSQALRTEYRITPHVYANWKILPWLEFKSAFGGDLRIQEQTKWKGYLVNYGTEGSIAGISGQNTYRWNWDNTININKEFGKHRINATLGMTTGRFQTSVDRIESWNIPEHKAQHLAINIGPNTAINYSESAYTEQSYFARALYNYADRYLLTATVRVDGSSKFSAANRYSVFPSLAAAWRFSEEPWIKNDVLSMGKLRAGWGQVGNSAVSAYQIYSTYSTSKYADHTPGNEAFTVVGLNPSNISNPGLKWETTEQWNLGLDLGFWDGRLSFTADIYDKYTYDLLQSKNISTSSGFSTMWLNSGSIRNRGLELAVDATPVSIGDFEWNISGQISWNRNTLVSLGGTTAPEEIYLSPDNPQECVFFYGSNVGSSNYLASPANIFIEGQPLGLLWGYKFNRVVPEGETGIPISEGGAARIPGQREYYDLNGNGHIDNYDKTIIGDTNPDFMYGFSTSFTWKDLTISASFDGAYGNEILNANRPQEEDVAYQSNIMTYWNIRTDAYKKAWTKENQNTRYPALGISAADNTERKMMSDVWVEDGSFLRLSNVAISYRLPIPKNKVVKNISVGVSGSNLYVFTKYSGWDPEVNSHGNSMKRIGVDIGSYPTARTYCFDLKFTF